MQWDHTLFIHVVRALPVRDSSFSDLESRLRVLTLFSHFVMTRLPSLSSHRHIRSYSARRTKRENSGKCISDRHFCLQPLFPFLVLHHSPSFPSLDLPVDGLAERSRSHFSYFSLSVSFLPRSALRSSHLPSSYSGVNKGVCDEARKANEPESTVKLLPPKLAQKCRKRSMRISPCGR